MSSASNIEWTDATWNPIVGCSIVSPGCTNCYAMKLAGRRLRNTPKYSGLTKDSNAGPVWTGEVRLWEKALTDPLHWRQPRKIFVNSEGDLFHESIPDEWIDRVFAVMALCPQHTFQVLTKRAERMRHYCWRLATSPWRGFDVVDQERKILGGDDAYFRRQKKTDGYGTGFAWPLPQVWLGVSCERQQEADERIPLLLQTPAAVRFISAEPLLGPINLNRIQVAGHGWQDVLEGWRHCKDYPGRENVLDWVIVGGESGPAARPMSPDWARRLQKQCAAAGTPFFFKQWGEWVVAYNRDKGAPFQAGDFIRVGKKAAGRLLDGVEHNGFPEIKAKHGEAA